MESGQIFKGMLLVSDIDGTLTELTEIHRTTSRPSTASSPWEAPLPCVPGGPNARWRRFCRS